MVLWLRRLVRRRIRLGFHPRILRGIVEQPFRQKHRILQDQFCQYRWSLFDRKFGQVVHFHPLIAGRNFKQRYIRQDFHRLRQGCDIRQDIIFSFWQECDILLSHEDCGQQRKGLRFPLGPADQQGYILFLLAGNNRNGGPQHEHQYEQGCNISIQIEQHLSEKCHNHSKEQR